MLNKDKIEFFFFLLFSKFFGVLGLRGTRRFARFFSAFLFYFVPIRKGVVISNLKKAFPEYPDSKIYTIVKKNYYNIVLTFFELMYFPYMKKQELLELVECRNLDLMIRKYKEGKGVILLTGHYGSWEIGAAWMGVKINTPLYVMAKPQRNEYVTKWVNNAREKFGNKVIPLGISIREIYSVIKNGGIVGVVGDQRGPQDGLRVKYFGMDTSVYPGTPQIALKTGCPIVISIVVRKHDMNYELFLYELNAENLTGTQEEKVKKIYQTYFDMLEKHVRLHPEQWFWMHKIWKY